VCLELDPRGQAVTTRLKREDVGIVARRLIGHILPGDGIVLGQVLHESAHEPAIVRPVELDLGVDHFEALDPVDRLVEDEYPPHLLQYTFRIAGKLTRSCVSLKLVLHNVSAPVKGAAVDTLLKTIARGNALWQRLQAESLNITELAKLEAMTPSYLTRILRLAFLDPWIVEQIIAGRQPAMLDARKLTLSGELPMRWNDQRAFAGFTATR